MASIHHSIFSQWRLQGGRSSLRLQGEAGYRSVSFTEARSLALRLSAFLRSRGVGPGGRVMMVSENGPEWGIAALAVMNLRAVLVPVASIASFLEIENTLRSARPCFCIFSRELPLARQLEELLQAERIAHLGWVLQAPAPLELLRAVPEDAEDGQAQEGETALLIYTSGTTGSPKGVPITHGNVLANAKAVRELLPVSSGDRLVSVLPLSHMLEFTGGFVLPSLLGAEITYIKGLKPEDLLRAMKDSGATVLIAVPLLFEVIARNLQARIDSLPGPLRALLSGGAELVRRHPSLGRILFFPVHRALGGRIRFLVAGGSRLHPQTFDFFRGLGLTLLQGYGLTETSPVLTLATLETAAADHVGRALPGVELGIFGENGEALAAGAEGEIWARGPSVFSGYLDPAHSVSAFSGPWFRTGDLGTLDPGGFLRITGRKKDIIVTAAGKNVYPEEIEGLVLASGNFLEVAALGLKDSGGHEKIALVLVPDRARFPGRTGNELLARCENEAAELCRALAEYKWPQKIVARLEELPKTSTRKVKKHELRKQLEAAAAAPAAGLAAGGSLNPADPVEGTIARGISEITRIEPERVRLGMSLSKDLGLDSLTFVELVGKVESRFQTRIEGVDFAAIQSVQDLIVAVQGAAPAGGLRRAVAFSEFAPGANRGWLWCFFRCGFQLLLRLLLRLRFGLRVEGRENLRPGRAYVFTPNHASHFDLLSVSAALPFSFVNRSFAVAAKDYFFNRAWKAIGARLFVNAIPFDRKGRVNESMESCRVALQEGGSLVIFPEGTRSPDGRLGGFKAGVGQLLAARKHCQAVPVYIDGAHQIMPKGSKWPAAGRLRIRFGPPISFGELSSEPESFRKIAERLRSEVVRLSEGRLR